MKSTINDPENSLPYHLRGAFRGFETALARYLVDFDVPASHFHILRLQWDSAGHTQSYIAEKSFTTESVASQIIRQMVEHGLLQRSVAPDDKRKRLVSLTKKGREIREKIVTGGMEISIKQALKISPEDMRTTMSVLKEIRRAFEIYNDDYLKNE